MSMVCPQCKQDYDKQADCPTCGCRLMYHLSAFDTPPPSPHDDNWQQTPWGRIAVGLLLAQGLAFGSQHLFTAWFMVNDESERTAWQSLFGLALLHLLHAVSLLIGAAVSGAGQSRGILYGSLIGLLHAVVFLVVQSQDISTLFMLAVYGQMALFAMLGAIGGWLGMLVWKPMPVLPLGGKGMKSVGFDWSIFALGQYFVGPIHYGRILIGIAIVVVGVLRSRAILNFIFEMSDGNFVSVSHFQDRLLLVEISALATLFGAGLAGATTFNGLKQGLFVGIGASVVLAGVQLGDGKMQMETIMLTVVSTMSLTLAGGCFGGQLVPAHLRPAATQHVRIALEQFTSPHAGKG